MNKNQLMWGCLALLLVFGVWYYIGVWIPFKKELDYLKMEYGRHFDEEQRDRYKKKLKRHYFKCIPVIRKFI